MTGFVSSVEFADGSYWLPSRSALNDPKLSRVISPSPEEQRLAQNERVNVELLAAIEKASRAC